jgi:hypothetical protein
MRPLTKALQAPPGYKESQVARCHPEQSRFSGVAKDLPLNRATGMPNRSTTCLWFALTAVPF